MYIDSKFWLGTETAFNGLTSAMVQAAQLRSMPGHQINLSAREDLGLPALYNLQNEVGVVSISGTLVDGAAGVMGYYGQVGYEDIRHAVMQALMDPQAKAIMLHVKSGGGSVNGLEDLGSFIQMAGTLKPISTYADGSMLSAAYWLGSYGKHITTSQTSLIGSLGVLFIHKEISQSLANDGVKVTVLRTGDFKALGTPYEVLSEAARLDFVAKGETLYGVFMGIVAQNRKVSLATADQVMGQGKEFLGAEAVSLGLADKIGTYEEALTYAKSLDTGRSRGNNSQKSTGAKAMKVTLNAAQLAAYIAGASMSAMGLSDTAVIENVPVEASAARTAAEAQAASVVDKAAFDTMKATNTTLAANIEALTANLSAAQAGGVQDKEALLMSQAATLTANKDLAATKFQLETLLPIARAATGKMQIALGSEDTTAAMATTELLAEHARVSPLYTTKFVPGGVAAAASSAAGKPAFSEADNALHAAMVASGPDSLRITSRK